MKYNAQSKIYSMFTLKLLATLPHNKRKLYFYQIVLSSQCGNSLSLLLALMEANLFYILQNCRNYRRRWEEANLVFMNLLCCVDKYPVSYLSWASGWGKTQLSRNRMILGMIIREVFLSYSFLLMWWMHHCFPEPEISVRIQSRCGVFSYVIFLHFNLWKNLVKKLACIFWTLNENKCYYLFKCLWLIFHFKSISLRYNDIQ